MPRLKAQTATGQTKKRVDLEVVLSSLQTAYFLLDDGDRFLDYRGPSDSPLLAPPETFLRKTIADVFPPSLAEPFTEACRKARNEGGTVQTEGSLRVGEVTRNFAARFSACANDDVIGLLRDTSEELHTERMLRESEERFRAFFRLSPLGSVISRAADGMILETNDALTRLTGYRGEELIGRTSLELGFYPAAEDRARLIQLLRATGRAEGIETTILTKSRETRKILFSAETIRLGEEDCLLAVVLDATERIQAREALEEAHRVLEARVGERTAELAAAKAQLEQDLRARTQAEQERDRLEEGLRRVQALEAVGRLAGGVAHDFNNLLGSILACAYAARTNSVDPGIVTQEMERIQELCQQGGEVTRHLLTVARESPGVVQTIDVRTEVERLRVLAERVMGRTIATSVRVDEHPLWVRGDRGLLTAALLNLSLNARDAMEAGGTLTIDAGRRRHGDRDWVAVSLADTGPGISEKVRDLIFQPFFTTKEGGRGTGLGLSTALATAQRFGGTIEVESSPGRGATFTLLLPAAEGTPPAPSTRAASPTAGSHDASGRRPLVLVVEDEEDVARMMEATLAAAGYRVLRARSGIVALEAVRDNRNEIRLALLDLILPGLGGTEVYRLLRTLAPEVPVAFATARPDLAEAVAPNTSCLRKPFTEQELLDAVGGAIAAARESA